MILAGRDTKLLSETDLALCATGRLTVTFAGNPATGCAARGLCGYSGTETWQPQGVGDLSISTLEQRGRRHTTATMFFGGFQTPVLSAVQRAQATGTTTACSDQSQLPGVFYSLPVSGDRVTVGLAHPQTHLLGTRCAGPLDADIDGALRVRTIGLQQIRRGRDTIDLSSSGRFASHGLAGTVRSTIVLVLGRPHRASRSGGSQPPPGAKASRAVTVGFRVTRVGGSAIAAVRSSPVPAVCGPYDACGLHGVIDVAPGTFSGGSAALEASAPLHRPKRDLLAALGLTTHGDPSGIGVLGGGSASVHGGVTADLMQQGTCRDQVALRALELQLRKRADRFQVSLGPALSQAADPLRTRCPGPDLGSHALTSASIPLSTLRQPMFTIKLHGGSFSNGPYRVTTRSTLSITLRRTKVTTQILPLAARRR